MRPVFPMIAAAALLLTAGGAARGQTAAPPAPFPFVLPWDDATRGTVTDVSFLNTKPAGAHGRIVVRDGHLVESGTGKRVRFLATNFAAASAFPSHADAAKVAARLAKLGINLVRLHHMDNNDWGPEAHVWDDSYKDRRHLNPAQIDRLDYLLAQFKKNGIYANLNLHVSRQFTAADGFPASVEKIPFGYDKRVDEFDRRMIALQKEYARDLLTHVNPYTHLSYAQDPAVAVVEINNENSLVGDPWATLGAGLDTLPEPFRGELVGFWNAWLTKKYGTDTRLQAAWLRGVTPPGPAINTRARWTLEHQGTAQAGAAVRPGSNMPLIGNLFGADYQITQVDGTDWHVQAHQTGLDFQEGETYTVSFDAKADRPRTMNVSAALDQADWHHIGLDADAALTTDWKPFRFTFDVHDTVPGHGRVAFALGNQTGIVSLRNLKVAPGAEGAGLPVAQSLARGTVDIPASATKNQHADWIAFLADTELAYAEGMRAYLRGTLHVRANVICSQVSWGGLTGVRREAGSDFADNHAYWQHPTFPHKPWDSQDWTIPNTSQTAALAAGGGGELRNLAEYRVAGKPYSISEYNEPAPNDFQAETLPLLATFAAFQDWDMLYLFDYGSYGASAKNDQIQGYFGIGSNPAKTAFLPAAAMIFRAQDFGTATGGTVLLLSPSETRGDGKAGTVWGVKLPGGPPDLSAHVALSPTSAAKAAELLYGDGPEPSSKLLVTKDGGGRFVASGPAAAALTGYVGGRTVKAGLNQFTFPTFGNNFAAVTVTAMDAKPLAASRKVLLTLAGKVENQEMHWNADRTSVGDQWGHGPTVAEGIPADVTLQTDGPRRVYALDGTGKRTQRVPAAYAAGRLTFTVGPQYRTVWYEIVK